MPAICVQNLVKQYKNGASKSTLIKILTTYSKADSGKAELLGKDLYEKAGSIRSCIACAAQRVSIDEYLSLTENMMFQSKLYKIPQEEAKRRMVNLAESFGLKRYMSHPVRSFSGGIKRRLDIALSMMPNPQILFLDEPTTGMDIQSRMAMWGMLKKIRDEFEMTIFLTTHYLEEAGQLSDTVCIMKEGREVLQGTPDELRGYLGSGTLKIIFETKQAARSAFENLIPFHPLRDSDLRGGSIFTDIENGREDMLKINRLLLEKEIPFIGIEITKPSLDDVFLRLTGEV